jgi:redox-sensitive bicupin YhaK (pirin superfamily)
MIQFSSIHSPTLMCHGSVFSARQYPRQAFGNLIDPVINIDWFEMSGPTFPPHPHAGFSAVTYVFADSPNGFVNRDSLGDVQNILPGGLHWSRASRGMMHEETPIEGHGPARGLQIFVNLPAANQADAEAAFAVPAAMVEKSSGEGWTSRTAVDGTTLGAAEHALPSPVRITEFTLESGASHDLAVPAGWGGMLIVLEGAATIGETGLSQTQAIGFASNEDDQIRIETKDTAARIVLVSGAQLQQPIYAHGPLMTATPAALDDAIRRVSHLSI